MATEVISTIGSDPGDDYTTLLAWYTARKGDLVARDTIEIAELRGETHTSGKVLGRDANVVDSTHYFVIRAMAGAEFRGDFGDVSGQAVVTDEVGSYNKYTKIFGIVVKGIVGSAKIIGIFVAGDSSDIDSCGVSNLVSSGTGMQSAVGISCSGSVDCAVKNCVVQDLLAVYTGTSGKVSDCIGIAYAAFIYNNLVANISAESQSSNSGSTASSHGISSASGVAYNNLVFSVSATAAYGEANETEACIDVATADYNATDDGTGGTNGITITPADEIEDTSTATFDCHLKPGADCIGAGTDLSAYGVDEDIDGDSRPQNTMWDIGADEYAPSVAIATATGAHGGTQAQTAGSAVAIATAIGAHGGTLAQAAGSAVAIATAIGAHPGTRAQAAGSAVAIATAIGAHGGTRAQAAGSAVAIATAIGAHPGTRAQAAGSAVAIATAIGAHGGTRAQTAGSALAIATATGAHGGTLAQAAGVVTVATFRRYRAAAGLAYSPRLVGGCFTAQAAAGLAFDRHIQEGQTLV